MAGQKSLYLTAAVAALLSSVGAEFLKRDLQASTISGWDYQGCYPDLVNGQRNIEGGYWTDSSVTLETCTTFCAGKGYLYAGAEYSRECFCSNTMKNTAQADAADCNMACAGDATEPCGGNSRLTVYKSKTTGASQGQADVGTFKYQGCYTDDPSRRTLQTSVATDGGNSALTPSKCIAACKAGGYKYAGTEYGGECYCGFDLLNGGAAASDGEAGCNMACNGDDTKICGGPNRLSLYLDSSAPSTSYTWSSAGCYTDNVNARTLETSVDVPGGSDSMTVEACTKACGQRGYKIAGLEWSRECWCGNSYMNGGSIASASECNMQCSGNTAEICGGSQRLSIYTPAPASTCASPYVCGTNTGNCGNGYEAQGGVHNCYCFTTVDQNGVQGSTCVPVGTSCENSCRTQNDCASGEVCMINNCCANGGTTCYPANKATCPNSAAPKFMFAKMKRDTMWSDVLGRYINVVEE